jgi:hydrogenase maturation protease
VTEQPYSAGIAGTVLVLGIGSPYRSDDAIGLWTAEILARMNLTDVRVRKEERDGVRMMEAWTGADDVIIIDAVSSGRRPGTVMRFDPEEIDVHTPALRCSSHGFGLAEAIALSKILGNLPHRMRIYGIEGESFGFGTAVSETVRAAGTIVAAGIAEELMCHHEVHREA